MHLSFIFGLSYFYKYYLASSRYGNSKFMVLSLMGVYAILHQCYLAALNLYAFLQHETVCFSATSTTVCFYATNLWFLQYFIQISLWTSDILYFCFKKYKQFWKVLLEKDKIILQYLILHAFMKYVSDFL